MSSLEIRKDPWAAFPSNDTTLAQVAVAMTMFDLEVLVDDELVVRLVQVPGTDREPPSTEELAQALYYADEDLIVAEESGVFELPEFEDLFDAEARDRHAEGV